MQHFNYLTLIATFLLSVALVPSAFSQDSKQENSQTQGTEATQPEKKSKVGRKLKQAIPDCISIIFSTCKDNSGRNEAEQERQDKELARAAKRCEELEKARPATKETQPRSTEPPRPEITSQESSSRNSALPSSAAPYCTPPDVLAAEHDVEVGDFSFQDKNYRGAEMRYRSALERLPDEPIATLHLARVLEKQGKSTEAYDRYQSYLSWSPTGKDAEEAQAAIKRLDSQARK
jgi:tetratricopeptide (TPR) repeat protein